MEDLTPEENQRQGQALYEITVWCQACNHHLGELTDQYHKEDFDKLIIKSKKLLLNISDPFYSSAGMHAIISVLVKANLVNDARELLAEVEVDFIKEKIIEENPVLG